MPKAVALKPGTSKRKGLASEEVVLDESVGPKKGRKDIKTEINEPTTSKTVKNDPTTSKTVKNNVPDRNESPASITSHTALMPKEMYNFCKSVLEMEGMTNVNLSRLKGNTKLAQLLRDNPIFDDSVDIGAFQHSFANFYRCATVLSEVSLSKALHTVMDYVQGEQMVIRHPKCPKRPPSAFTRFAMQTGSDLFKSGGKMSVDYKNDQDPRVVKAKQEYVKDRERYLAELREFLDSHKDELFEAQIQFLQKEIKNKQKAVEQKDPTKKRRSNGIKQPQKELPTAFELYKRSKEQKYDRLSPDEREAKLRRHFDKLSDEQREIYESIAASLQ